MAHDYIKQLDIEKYIFHKGESFKSYEFFGCHRLNDGRYSFSVWAPNAKKVRLVGEFNRWQGEGYEMHRVSEHGIYNLILEEACEGQLYKYEIFSAKGKPLYKADPYAIEAELRPGTASKVATLPNYDWQDEAYMKRRRKTPPYKKPMNIYEMHMGSWMLKPDGSFHSYTELIDLLIPYLKSTHYTHVEFLPLMEHPFDGSWGYQTTGYFALTSRYGRPEDFMALVDALHQADIGVILDWVPVHYCRDAHGLSYFDGDNCYESAYKHIALNHQWGTNHFDFSRKEVWSFLISNAVFWFEKYHIDGLRVDAVAYMIYSDYGKPGLDGVHGYTENPHAVAFVKKLNETIFSQFPNALMIAEESSAWPKLTHPIDKGGLGFNFKWNMGWMNDTLRYFSMDYEDRHHAHHLLNFSLMYAFNENYVLPFSHDEVVHGKKSLVDRMPGDYWQKFANLRVLLAYQMMHPGKKLSFMGTELAHFIEWNYKRELDWFLLDYESHNHFSKYVAKLNAFYLDEPALSEVDDSFKGFQWVDADNASQSVLIFERKGRLRKNDLLILLNLTPETYTHFEVGVKDNKAWTSCFNSDDLAYGGSGWAETAVYKPQKKKWHQRPYAISVKLPGLAAVVLKRKEEGESLG